MKLNISYGSEGCHAVITDADGVTVARTYTLRAKYATWEECRDAAVEVVTEAARKAVAYGPMPEPEEREIDVRGDLHAA